MMMKKYLVFVWLCIILIFVSACSRNDSALDDLVNKEVDIIGFQEQTAAEKVMLDVQEYRDFIQQTNIDRMTYPYAELFGIDAAWQEKGARDFSVAQHAFDFLGADTTVDADNLADTVKQNNAAYMETSSLKRFYDQPSNKELREYCGYIADAVNWCIQNYDTVDLWELSCKLGNLKILEKNSENYGAYIGPTGLLYLSPSSLKTAIRKDADAVKATVTHEAMHICQSRCGDVEKSEDDAFVGPSYSFADLQVNPLKTSWLYEGSAELSTSHFLAAEPRTYTYMVQLIESLDLAMIPNEVAALYPIERNCCQHEPAALYQLLGFQDEKQAAAFLYSAEIMLVKPDDFFEAYAKHNGEVDDKPLFADETYKAPVYETVSKIFYRNFAKKLSETEMSLNDVFYLISLHEREMNQILQLKSADSQERYHTYIENYEVIKSAFFALLGDDTVERYDTYEMDYDDGGKYANACFDWLSAEKKEYLLQQHDLWR